MDYWDVDAVLSLVLKLICKEMKTFKSIFKPVAIWLVAAVSFTACEVDTTTVMFEEDHNFSEPSDTVFPC